MHSSGKNGTHTTKKNMSDLFCNYYSYINWILQIYTFHVEHTHFQLMTWNSENRPYALMSSRHHVGGRSHRLVCACDLLLAHRWQLHLHVILYPPSEGAMRLWHQMHKVYTILQWGNYVLKIRTPNVRPLLWKPNPFGQHNLVCHIMDIPLQAVTFKKSIIELEKTYF